MTKLLSSFGLAISLALSLTGCELYFGGNDGDGRGGGGGGAEPGWSCTDNADCAAGCYCSDGNVCEEAGFCSTNADCPTGYVCDDRSSCVPDPQPTCEFDVDCAAGSFCNDSGVCETSCVCTNDAEAQAQGYQHCDETRMTCKPENAGGTCGGAATCGTEPSCPAGSVALIGLDGCYTGVCSEITTCDVAPACSAYQHEADCFSGATAGCRATYTGINCTRPDGSACQSGDSGCTCESFRFASCE